ncbi:MAG: hypothetical protein ACREGI_04995 [Candidatus Levyibacteriota bacterium]
MKAKIFMFFASLILLFTSYTFPIQAQEKASGSSASLSDILTAREQGDNRAIVLTRFLEQYNFPLAQYADTFVTQADLYNIDWRLVVAISGVESTYGKQIPNCPNAWGWGIFGDQTYCFTSFDEGIRVISRDLRQKYMDAWGAKDVYEIGRLYAASPTWASRVSYIMDQIHEFSLNSESAPLPISL